MLLTYFQQLLLYKPSLSLLFLMLSLLFPPFPEAFLILRHPNDV